MVTENPCRFFVDAQPAHVAALAGDLETLRQMLAHDPSVGTSQRDLHQGNLLHAAVAGGSLEVVEVVYSAYPAMLDEPNMHGVTALLIAVKYGFTEVAQWLLRAGASVSLVTLQGLSVVHVAAREGHTELLHALLETAPELANLATTEGGRTPLHTATTRGHVDGARDLLAHGADVNARSADGLTALHVAVAEGQVEVLVALLAAPGIDPNLPDAMGMTSLHYAAQRGRVEVTRQLLEVGANPLLLANGVSVMQMALSNGYTQVRDILQQWLRQHPPAMPTMVVGTMATPGIMMPPGMVANGNINNNNNTMNQTPPRPSHANNADANDHGGGGGGSPPGPGQALGGGGLAMECSESDGRGEEEEGMMILRKRKNAEDESAPLVLGGVPSYAALTAAAKLESELRALAESGAPLATTNAATDGPHAPTPHHYHDNNNNNNTNNNHDNHMGEDGTTRGPPTAPTTTAPPPTPPRRSPTPGRRCVPPPRSTRARLRPCYTRVSRSRHIWRWVRSRRWRGRPRPPSRWSVGPT